MSTLRQRAIERIKNDTAELAAAIQTARARGYIVGDIALCHALEDIYDVSLRSASTATLALLLIEVCMNENAIEIATELRVELDKFLETVRAIADKIERMYVDFAPAPSTPIPYHKPNC